MNIIDTHCHIDVEQFDIDRSHVLMRSRASGVERIIVPGIQASSWDSLSTICAGEEDLYPAFGLHPVFLQQHGKHDLEKLKRYLREKNPVAVGEIGLDFHLTELDREKQIELFKAQLDIACEARLPVILHARKSHDVILSMLKSCSLPGGVCHAFNGSLQQAEKYIALGFRLGFGGMLTYEHSHKLHRLAIELPLTSIVLETDSPDMVGERHRGQRNSPEFLAEVLYALASLRGQDPELVARQTTENAKSVFSLH